MMTTFALAAMTAALAGFGASPVEGVRLAIRVTARTSLLFFLAAFVASAAARLWPGRPTAWMLRNRRYLGLSFAASHGLHAIVIVALARLDPGLFWTLTNPTSVVTGGIAYAFIVLMAATSTDGMARWLGPRNWRWLHTAGAWFIWISFVFTNGKRIPVSLWYALPVAILLVALAVRLAARRRKTQGTRTVSSATGSVSG